jgi:hypothetical protein
VAFKRVSQSVGVSVSAEFVERRIGTGAAQTFRDILQTAGKPFDDLIKRLLEKKDSSRNEHEPQGEALPGA